MRHGDRLEPGEGANVGPVLEGDLLELVADPVGEGGEAAFFFKDEGFEERGGKEKGLGGGEEGGDEGRGEGEGGEFFGPG